MCTPGIDESAVVKCGDMLSAKGARPAAPSTSRPRQKFHRTIPAGDRMSARDKLAVRVFDEANATPVVLITERPVIQLIEPPWRFRGTCLAGRFEKQGEAEGLVGFEVSCSE